MHPNLRSPELSSLMWFLKVQTWVVLHTVSPALQRRKQVDHRRSRLAWQINSRIPSQQTKSKNIDVYKREPIRNVLPQFPLKSLLFHWLGS